MSKQQLFFFLFLEFSTKVFHEEFSNYLTIAPSLIFYFNSLTHTSDSGDASFCEVKMKTKTRTAKTTLFILKTIFCLTKLTYCMIWLKKFHFSYMRFVFKKYESYKIYMGRFSPLILGLLVLN